MVRKLQTLITHVSKTFFKRAVRDLSAELGKEIELTTEGAETELDKTVIKRLSDPLVRLIRNSIAHLKDIPVTVLKNLS